MKKLVRLIRTSGVVALGIGVVPLFACNDEMSIEAIQSEAVTSTAETEYGGETTRIWDQAFAEAQLRPEQRPEVDKLRSEYKARHEPVRAAKRELMSAVAAQIETGKIDRCALASPIKEVASAMAQARPADRAALERLHEIMDPDQRAKFVDALRRGWEARERARAPRAMAEKVEKELNLTPDQGEKLERIFTGLREVRDAQPAKAENRERWRKMLDAFKTDRFVIDEAAPMGDVAAQTTEKLEFGLWAGEAVVPVLNAEQRRTLAQRIREKASAHDTEGG